MNRFNKVANIEENSQQGSYLCYMKTTMSMATYFMATMYLKEFDNLTINWFVCSKSSIVII